MDYGESEDFLNWKPNLSISEIFDISEFKEKLFYVDLILTNNDGWKVLDNVKNYPESPKEWLLDNKSIKLSDGYSSIIMDKYTYRIFLDKDSTQRCSDNFCKIYALRVAICKDLREAKNG